MSGESQAENTRWAFWGSFWLSACSSSVISQPLSHFSSQQSARAALGWQMSSIWPVTLSPPLVRAAWGPGSRLPAGAGPHSPPTVVTAKRRAGRKATLLHPESGCSRSILGPLSAQSQCSDLQHSTHICPLFLPSQWEHDMRARDPGYFLWTSFPCEHNS